MPTPNPITEISLRRTPCRGACPVYRVTIRAGGRFHYVGKRHVARLGEYSGQVNRRSLDQLARLIREAGFMDFEDRYATHLTDQPTAHTAVLMGGVRKEVSNYGAGGPAVLWAIEELIDKLLSEAEWDEKSPSVGG